MEAKRNKFDILTTFFLLAMIFTLGFHSAKGRSEIKKETLTANVSLEKIVGKPRVDEICYIDERYPLTATEIKDTVIVFTCSGNVTEAGFLLDGAKYLSENQPVRIFWESGFCEGRILTLGDERR